MTKHAIAGLVGLARLGMLCAQTKTSCALVAEVAEMTDFRDALPEAFLEAIDRGTIRTDAFWSHGPDGFLCRLVSLYREEEGR